MKNRIRKFYLRSKLNFGRYAGKTVQEVIDMGEGPYLRWCDVRMNRITFAAEVDIKRFSIGHIRLANNDDDIIADAFELAGGYGYGDHE